MKNPKECFCLRQQQTFFVLNELTPAECKDGSEPLTFHHEIFSRMKMVIINQEKKAVTANIPVSDIPAIFEEVKAKNMLRKLNSCENKTYTMIQSIGRMTQSLVHKFVGQDTKQDKQPIDTSTPAFTVVITSGRLKGKTPAGALLEDADINKKLLENQATWLQSNLKNYPKNQIQINAIQEALNLFEKGLLKQSSAGEMQHAEKTSEQDKNIIYKTGFRPLIRRKNANGKCFVYEIQIIWHDNMPKPIEIDIKNYFAPVVQTDKGLLNVQAKNKEDEIHNTFSMSMEEWLWMEHQINTQLRTFENLYAPQMYKTANNDDRANKAKAMS